ncbi:iron uptake transporter deferrochelatase/peroxidase subunit [Aquipuribacter hungaricus]|uniref:Deferrochelatase n=1 Tax=Aquipuribacter hungaricus TaxID=545624 RepID=A0ABV7WH14_9MICO
MSGVSRRRLLGLAGAGAGGLALGVGAAATAAATGLDDVLRPDRGAGDGTAYPFHGPHQAGITTPAQDHLHFAAFDVTTTSRDDLVAMLQAWSVAAERMTRGAPAGEGDPASGAYDAPPDDTGEAMDLPPAGLTITIGFGPGLFQTADGTDRFGLAARRPASLERLPHFPADALDPARSDGDLCVQACADDPQVAVHAVRNLARIAFGTASLRWSQLGFGRTATTSDEQVTPRNLFGFKDGTANITAQQDDALAEHVWVPDADTDASTAWLAGGSYLVARRIAMTIEPWDRTSLREQEAVVGRTKGEGAPLSGGTEHDEPDLAMAGRGGLPLVAENAHVRLAHPSTNGGVRMLRRGYNYTDGITPLGRLDAGLFFLAFVRDPATHYVPMQTRMSAQDGLMEYLQHVGSGLFAVPPGAPEGGWVGQQLFA